MKADTIWSALWRAGTGDSREEESRGEQGSSGRVWSKKGEKEGGVERKTIRKRERTRQNLLGKGLGTEARG